MQRRVLGPEHPDTLLTAYYLGDTTTMRASTRRPRNSSARTLRPEGACSARNIVSTLSSMNGLANAYSEQGKYAQAEALYKQILEVSRRVLGPEHPNTLLAISNLALDYYSEGSSRKRKLFFARPWRLGVACWVRNIRTRCLRCNIWPVCTATEGDNAHADVMFNQTLEIDAAF